jgi:hypothetical protein
MLERPYDWTDHARKVHRRIQPELSVKDLCTIAEALAAAYERGIAEGMRQRANNDFTIREVTRSDDKGRVWEIG